MNHLQVEAILNVDYYRNDDTYIYICFKGAEMMKSFPKSRRDSEKRRA